MVYGDKDSKVVFPNLLIPFDFLFVFLLLFLLGLCISMCTSSAFWLRSRCIQNTNPETPRLPPTHSPLPLLPPPLLRPQPSASWRFTPTTTANYTDIRSTLTRPTWNGEISVLQVWEQLSCCSRIKTSDRKDTRRVRVRTNISDAATFIITTRSAPL